MIIVPSNVAVSTGVVELSGTISTAAISWATSPTAAVFNSAANRIYFVDSTSNKVGRIILSNNSTAIESTLSAGTAPSAVAVDGNFSSWISCSGSNQVQKFNAGVTTPSNTITVGTSPSSLCFNPTNSTKLYVANYGSNNVSVITNAAVSKTITVGTNPKHLAVSPDGTKLYVANYNSGGTTGSVSVIDTSTETVTNTITVGKWPVALAINPDGSKVYVANSGTLDSVSVISTSTNSVTSTLSSNIFANATAIGLNSTGTRLYVAWDDIDGYFTSIDTTTGETINYIFGWVDRVTSMAVTSANKIYCTNTATNIVTIFS